jgi:hypothetical protein
MLVHRQQSARIKYLLICGGGLLLIGLGYIGYQKFSSGGTSQQTSTNLTKMTVPKDFGQKLFKDPRFYALRPKVGTQLLKQTEATVPGSGLNAPGELQVFDVRSGNKAMLIWKTPKELNTSTDLTIERAINGQVENLANLGITSTSFIDTTVPNSQQATYAVAYVAYEEPQTSQQVVVKTGQASEVIGANSASFTAEVVSDGIKLDWSLPQPAEEYSTDIFRSDTVGVLGKRVARFDSTVQEFIDASGKPDIYFYTLRWYKKLVTGESATATITASDQMNPEPPKSITVNFNQELKIITITWSPSTSSDVDHYDVYRSLVPLKLGDKLNSDGIKPDPTQPLETVTLKYEDNKISDGQTYYYSVLAVDKAGNVSHYQELQRAGKTNIFGEL